MSWGFNFRATSGYVTDAANQTYVIGDSYPVTRNGITFGWESQGSDPNRDRNSASPYAPELSGIVQHASGDALSEAVFRVDLPAAGDYGIVLAAGDASFDNAAFFEIRDYGTVLISESQLALTAGQFVGASLTLRTSASDWRANNVEVVRTFGSTVFRFALKRPTTSVSVLAHITLRRIIQKNLLVPRLHRSSRAVV